MKKHISLMLTFIMMVSLLNVIPISNTITHAQSVMDAPVLDTISTFFNESVELSYQASANASFVVPVSVATTGDLSVDIDTTDFTEDYLVRIYSDDSYIGLIQTTLLTGQETSHKIDITMGGASTIYMYFIPAVTPDASASGDASSEASAEASSDAINAIMNFKIKATLKQASEQEVNESKTLSNKTWTKKRVINKSSSVFYKVNVSTYTALQLTSNNTYINVCLYNSTKKSALSSIVPLKSANNFHTTFALKKGTYYIKVTSDYQASYQLYSKMVKVPVKYGTTLKKAKSISLNETVVGLLDANKKKNVGEFYKVKLTSDTKLQLAFYVECTSGSFMLEVYDSSKKELSTSNFRCTNSSLLYINSTSEMPAGTYYFKVSKTKKATSGCYALIAKKR